MAKLKSFTKYLAERYRGIQAMDKPPLSEPNASKEMNAYYAPNAKDTTPRKVKDVPNDVTPLAHQASPGFESPGKVMPLGVKPERPNFTDGKKKKKVKMRTEAFMEKTRNMSPAEFTSYMLNKVQKTPRQNISDIYGEQFTPEPIQTIRYISDLTLANENMMGRMVRELKRNNGLSALLKEVFQHPETYNLIIEAIENGTFGVKPQRKLVKMVESAIARPRWTQNPKQQNPVAPPQQPGMPNQQPGMPPQPTGEEEQPVNPNMQATADPNFTLGNDQQNPQPQQNANDQKLDDDDEEDKDDEEEDNDENDDIDDEEDTDEDEDDDEEEEGDEDDEEENEKDPMKKKVNAFAKQGMQNMQNTNSGPGMPNAGTM